MAKPFDKRILNIIEIIVEFCLCIVTISHCLFLVVPEYDDDITIFMITL